MIDTVVFIGGNATAPFEETGHSTDARELLEQYYIAELDEVKMFFAVLV